MKYQEGEGWAGARWGRGSPPADTLPPPDIVLAMQLSAMCFGALFALCIVACCAYKICGPAEEEEWGSRYSVLKPTPHPRLPPELLREIYTLPSAPTSTTTRHTAASKPQPSPAPTAASRRETTWPTGASSVMVEGGPRVTSVSRSPLARSAAATLGQLPNGRPGEPPLEDILPAAPPRPATPRGTPKKSPRLPALGSILEGQPCLPTLASLSSSRARDVAGHGAANRLAAHDQTSSTLDLARAAAAINYTHRARPHPHTAVV